MPTLYDYILNDDCYKVRILLAMLQLQYKAEKINVHPGEDHKSAAFLALNPLGSIPLLVDDDLVVRDAQAILTYLAIKYDASRKWLPTDAASAGKIAMWLAFAGSEVSFLSRARAHALFGSEPGLDLIACRDRARAATEILDDHLAEGEIAGRQWIATDGPTIADVAMFPPLAMAAESGLALEPYPAVWRWIARFKRLPNFVVMPGVLPLLPGVAA
jgi:glutathione S-transferase